MLGLVGIVSIISCLIVLNLPISVTITVAIIALIFASSTYYIMRDALLILPRSWQSIEVNSQGELSISSNRGKKIQPTLASNCFIHANLIILSFKKNGFELPLPAVILFTSAKNENELRRLRIWLRWFKHHEDDDLSTPEFVA